jgi:hypothetical protein
MTEEEIKQRVKEILLKRDLGEDLTSQEETILAYAYYAAGEQASEIRHRDRYVAQPLFGEAPTGIMG